MESDLDKNKEPIDAELADEIDDEDDDDMGGWIKLYRSMTNCKTGSRGLGYFGAMAWFVARANYEDSWYEGDEIKRGQLFVGYKKLSEEWKIGIQSIRTIIAKLKKDKFLTIKSTNKGTILTICNYERYQRKKRPTNKQSNTRVTRDQHAGNNLKEEKEVKEDKEYNTPPAGDPKRSGRKPYRIIFEYDGDERIHGIVKKDLDDWKEFYPALDIEAELKAASAWLKGNRTRRKKDILKFLTGWLQRAQDRAKKENVVAPEKTPDDEWERIKRQCANQ